jgi:hypothetical protein
MMDIIEKKQLEIYLLKNWSKDLCRRKITATMNFQQKFSKFEVLTACLLKNIHILRIFELQKFHQQRSQSAELLSFIMNFLWPLL